MAVPELAGLQETIERVDQLLLRAKQIKASSGIEPPLPVSEFTGQSGIPVLDHQKALHFTLIELVSRQKFHELAAFARFDAPEFVNVWNLLDILAICGDQAQCDPALVWWLVEELLESQSIEGCRVVFDYLDSRRERLVSRDFAKKELVILRSFNELLRRLSRAEDAVFCGRILIFLSQSFVLGTKSTTNNRGEFNVSNVTTYEEIQQPTDDTLPDADDILPDVELQQVGDATTGKEAASDKDRVEDSVLDADVLFPIFWSLQQAFSNPPLMSEPSKFQDFKSGLEATLKKFTKVPKVSETVKSDAKPQLKRTAEEMEDADDFTSNFNPKYLTSRDLFELELSDLTFQRDILVQALILLQFLLSLTEKAKEESAKETQNKLQYNFTLTEDDEAWVRRMRRAITDYLEKGYDGKQYLRMVDTVLSRDKNWVRWKMQNCPEISRSPVTAKEFEQSKEESNRMCTVRRLRAAPLGALDLRFLSENDSDDSLSRLRSAQRFAIPKVATLVSQIETTELDLDMASGDEKNRLESTKDSQTWGVLRCAVRTAYLHLSKVEDGRELRSLVSPVEEAGKGEGTPLPDEADAGESRGGGGNDDDVPGTTVVADEPPADRSEQQSGQAVGDAIVAE